MNDRIQFGERLFLPVYLRPPRRNARWPASRPLWVYVLDPANVGMRNSVALIDVPYEPLAAGPCGACFEVDHRPLPAFICKALAWPQRLIDDFDGTPLNLDDPVLAVAGGMRPSTGEPLFAGQMVYAVCQRVHDTFHRALGRWPTWGPWAARRIRDGKLPRLRLRPFGSEKANASYDAGAGALEFGAFRATRTDSEAILPGGMVFLALSHDVIAHEVTHALLDGARAHYLELEHAHVDGRAFHEAFADIVALFHHFRYRDVVEQALEEANGDLDSDVLLGLAREFGEALHGEPGKALRRAFPSQRSCGDDCRTLRCQGAEPSDPHDRGAVLVSAVFTAYRGVFQRQAAPLFRLAGMAHGSGCTMPRELIGLLADQACRLADEFLQICIRAIDYCPPVDLRFGEYLRAMITADRCLDPTDAAGVRDELIKAFRRANVELSDVLDLSQFSLEWNGPERAETAIPALAWSRLELGDDGVSPASVGEVERQASELAGSALKSQSLRQDLGLELPGRSFGPIIVESIRPVARLSRTGLVVHGLVAELSQRCLRSGQYGGSTIVFDETGRVVYAIRKRVRNAGARLLERREYAEPVTARLHRAALA